MASRLDPGVAERPSTRNWQRALRMWPSASTISALPAARWHSSTTTHVTLSYGQIPGRGAAPQAVSRNP